ncbi:hypothetical protein Tco_0222081 [Tanacetum coccineum]
MRDFRGSTFVQKQRRGCSDHLIGSLAIVGLFQLLESSKDQSCSEFFPSLLLELQKDGWTDSPQELSIPGISSRKPLSKAESLIAIQTMADHSQKWHDGSTSRNIGRSSSKDRLAALVNKLDNLGRDMKKLKESVHAIQAGCKIYEGPHIDNDCPLNEEASCNPSNEECDGGSLRNNEIRCYWESENDNDRGTSDDEDVIEGIIDYLEPTSYDGFIDLDEEEYTNTCWLLGLLVLSNHLHIIEQVKITRYSLGPGEVYTKVEVLNMEKLPRTRNNIATIRHDIMDEVTKVM